MNIHFIAIGGSAMHNLAIALHLKGYIVTGSDDEIFEPSHSRLMKYGILPDALGWFPEKIHHDIDAVILGMHARNDNPELIAAQSLGLKIFSYPEFLFEQSKHKTRVVIGGSHGKTTITSMILNILAHAGIDTDYMVGAQLDGFDVMVKLSDHAKWMVLEGDEYLTSPLDRRPKFLHYHPHIALISGIGWDHVNVFPEYDMYLDQFRQFISAIEAGGMLVYNAEDEEVVKLALQSNCSRIPYHTPEYRTQNGYNSLIDADGNSHPLQIFGAHNMSNISAAIQVCLLMGVPHNVAVEAMTTFKGASRRLECVLDDGGVAIYRDFAHAPSKVRASTAAMRQKFPECKLVACLELHTYSSLSASFINQYKNTLADADHAIVFYDPHAVALKKLPPVSPDEIADAFAKEGLQVISTTSGLRARISELLQPPVAVLMMSSGSFGGLDMQQLINK